MDMNKDKKIAIIELGYVGLPLAIEFSKKYAVTGFDINKKRVGDLRSGNDFTLEVNKPDLLAVLKNENNTTKGFYVTNVVNDISLANVYIVTVPTPIDIQR